MESNLPAAGSSPSRGLGGHAPRDWPGRICPAQGASWDACTQTHPCTGASYIIKYIQHQLWVKWLIFKTWRGEDYNASTILTIGWGRWLAGWISCRHKLPDIGPVPVSRRRSSKQPHLEVSAADIALLGLLKHTNTQWQCKLKKKHLTTIMLNYKLMAFNAL